MDKKGWVGGQPNVHDFPLEVGWYYLQCPRGHSVFHIKNFYIINLVGYSMDY